MGPQPAPPVQRWLEFFGLSPEQAYEKQLEHARGFTEEHNHYNGVLSPQQYIDVWLLLFGTAPGNAKTGVAAQGVVACSGAPVTSNCLGTTSVKAHNDMQVTARKPRT